MRREDLEAVETVMELGIERRRERPKKWFNRIECDMRTMGVYMNDVED